MALNVAQLRKDFPILNRTVHGRPLIYLDNAATSQKPQVVIDALSNYYTQTNANVHRGVHQLSEQATVAFEQAREVVAEFLGFKESRGCIFVRGATEAINLVADTWGRTELQVSHQKILTAVDNNRKIVKAPRLAPRAPETL
jgi:cysteine desulfurase/selenocysteine lyase